MNPDGGYTRSYRRKWDNPIFANKQQAAVWAWMCDVAQWCDGHLMTRFGKIELKRGELLAAEREIAEDFGINRNILRNLLQRMTDAGMIEMVRDRGPQRAGTVVRIVNYDGYQGTVAEPTTATGNQPQNGPQTNRKPTANGAGKDEPYQGFPGRFEDASNRKPTANQPQTEQKPDQEQVSKQTKEIGEPVCVVDANPAPAREAAHTAAPPDFPKSSNVVPIKPDSRPEVLPLPAGWVPSAEQMALARSLGLKAPEMAVLKFRDYWRRKGAARDAAGWCDAWEWWVRKDAADQNAGMSGAAQDLMAAYHDPNFTYGVGR